MRMDGTHLTHSQEHQFVQNFTLTKQFFVRADTNQIGDFIQSAKQIGIALAEGRQLTQRFSAGFHARPVI